MSGATQDADEGITEVVTLVPPTDTWTVDDLDALPDDGLRHELVDGTLLVTPAPRPLHQRGVLSVARLLADACPPDLEVLVAPFDFRPTSSRSFQPDVLVVRREDLRDDGVHRAPLLIVEVLAPGTRVGDATLERHVHAEAGVPSYWLLDPDAPSLQVLALDAGAYAGTALVAGDEEHRATAPFPVTVRPSSVVS